MKPLTFEAEVVAELREVAYRQDWSGSALATVVGIVRKVGRRRRLSRRRARRKRGSK